MQSMLPLLRRPSRLLLRPGLRPGPPLTRSAHVKYPPPPSHYEDSTTSQTKPGYTLRISFTLFLIGAILSYNYPLYSLGEAFYPLPAHDDDIAAYTAQLESKLMALPQVSALLHDTDYSSHRGWNHLDQTAAGLPTFHGTLRTPGGIAIPPLAFHNSSTGDDIAIIHLGRRLSGFPFIVHGGISGMVSEETFKAALQRQYPHLHYNDIHTKSLSLNYKSPLFVNQFVVITSSQSKLDDSHYTLIGEIKSLDGKSLLKASATLATESFNTQPPKKWLW